LKVNHIQISHRKITVLFITFAIMQTAAFYTLGCKLNFAETSTVARQFLDAGFQKVNFEDGADVYVINTCSVTDHADRKCKKVVAEAKRHNPQARVVIIGCYAQLKPEEIAKIPGVDLVLGAHEKFNILEFLPNIKHAEKPIVAQKKIKETTFFIPSYSIGDRTRTFLKVQDGCDYFCAFCTIPLARGASRNETIEKTVAVAREIAQSDVKEIVLTGVNIGDFGQSTGENFLDLIRALDEVEGIERFRISSIEPNLLTDEIIDFVAASNKFVPHFHIPLQSGSDKILERMRRKYKRDVYTSRVQRIKQRMPDACIGVDVIVGFPGETHEDFLETYQYLNELDVNYLHVFTYSERARTTAIKMDGKVPMAERKKRTHMLRILSEKKRHHFYEQHLGKTFTVLFEAENDGGNMYGFTENYIKVVAPYDPMYVNELQPVKLTGMNADGLMNCRFDWNASVPESLRERLVKS
jgi:threonylcarbamoyladenosine tRNA methylthiotransferase MtaB